MSDPFRASQRSGAKRVIRDQRGWPLLDWLMEDVAFGFRLMRKNALLSIPPPDRSRSASTRCR